MIERSTRAPAQVVQSLHWFAGRSRHRMQLRPAHRSREAGNRRTIMTNDEPIRRDVLQAIAAVPFMALLRQAGTAPAQVGVSPVKVDTKGLVAKIRFEAPLEGFLKEINGKYKLRVTELTLAPGGHVGEHNHEVPGIRQVTSGYMTYVLPDKTVVYGP